MRLRSMRRYPPPDPSYTASAVPPPFLVSALNVRRHTTCAGHVVLSPVGELESATVPKFRQAIAEIGPGQRVIIDMAETPFLDSCGIGAIIGAVRRVRELGGVVSLAAPCRPVQRVLNLAGVDRIVDVADTVADAAASFDPGDTGSPNDGDRIAI